MSNTNLGGQVITYDYKQPAQAKEWNTSMRGLIKPGFYSGDEPTQSGNDILIPIFRAYVNVNHATDDKGINVYTESQITYASSPGEPTKDYLVMNYTWYDAIENWLDFEFKSEGELDANDIIITKVTYSGANLSSIDNTVRTIGLLFDDDLTTDIINAPDTAEGTDIPSKIKINEIEAYPKTRPTVTTRLPHAEPVYSPLGYYEYLDHGNISIDYQYFDWVFSNDGILNYFYRNTSEDTSILLNYKWPLYGNTEESYSPTEYYDNIIILGGISSCYNKDLDLIYTSVVASFYVLGSNYSIKILSGTPSDTTGKLKRTLANIGLYPSSEYIANHSMCYLGQNKVFIAYNLNRHDNIYGLACDVEGTDIFPTASPNRWTLLTSPAWKLSTNLKVSTLGTSADGNITAFVVKIGIHLKIYTYDHTTNTITEKYSSAASHSYGGAIGLNRNHLAITYSDGGTPRLGVYKIDDSDDNAWALDRVVSKSTAIVTCANYSRKIFKMPNSDLVGIVCHDGSSWKLTFYDINHVLWESV